MKLRHITDLRAIAWTATLMSLLFLNWTSILRNAWTHLATFPLAFIASIICDNHIHLGLFRHRPANQTFSIFLSLVTGNPPTSIITAHHDRSSMHWSKLPAYHRREIAPHIDPQVNHRTLFGAIMNRLIA